jgi:hypothetical protein
MNTGVIGPDLATNGENYMISNVNILEKLKGRLFIIGASGTFILVVLTALVIWSFYNSKTITKPPVSSSSPIPPKGLAAPRQSLALREEAQKIKAKLTQTDKKSGDLILLDNESQTIRYLILNDEFIVSVKKPPFEVVKKEVEDWFKKKGFTSQDICLLRISFVSSKTVKPNLSQKDIFPTGCSIPAKPTANP